MCAGFNGSWNLEESVLTFKIQKRAVRDGHLHFLCEGVLYVKYLLMSRYNIYNYLAAGSWPLHADCGQVDHAGQGGQHLHVADHFAHRRRLDIE